MIEKKNIDRLFQEKFKEFDTEPNPLIWSRIQHELNPDKKSKRAFALWFRIGGIAATIILLISLGSLAFNSNASDGIENTIVDTNLNDLIESQQLSLDTQLVNSTNLESSTSNIDQDSFDTLMTNQQANSPINQQQSITNNTSKNNQFAFQNPFSGLALTDEDFSVTSNLNYFRFSPLINTTNSSEVPSLTESNNINSPSKNDDLIDSYIASLDKSKTNGSNNSKWSVTPSVAPVFFNSLGNSGSTIGSDFNNNSKSSDLNISYGLKGSYAINNRLNIRTGVHKVNLGFNTNDVVLFNTTTSLFTASNRALSTSALRNINLNNAAGDKAIISSVQLDNNPNTIIINQNSSTSIEQRFGFIEVPLELQYAVIDRKIGFNVIGGFSALFLDNNEVFSTVDGQTTLIGEANNINSTSYSANFGLGIKYKFSKLIDLNIEPTFKYQINTFENTTGDFQPYFFGIYSGFKFKF